MVSTPDPGLHARERLEEEPTSGLLGRLLSDSTALARNEIALAKAELRSSLAEFKLALASLAMAGAILLAGFLTLVAAGVIALARIVEWWLAALLVGVALAAVGAALIYAGKRKFSSTGTELERTQNSLQKDATVVARRT